MSRTRYVMRPNEAGEMVAVEVGSDWVEQRRDGNKRSEEEVFGHLQATDGTDLSTRRRWREYQQRNGLANVADYKETWAKAEAQKKAGITPGSGHDSKARREALGQLAYQLESKRRRR